MLVVVYPRAVGSKDPRSQTFQAIQRVEYLREDSAGLSLYDSEQRVLFINPDEFNVVLLEREPDEAAECGS